MLGLIALALVQAVPVAQQAPLPIPMSQAAWASMSHTERLQYADATIQGLRRNPVLAQCEALTPEALVRGLDSTAKADEPLMMAVARTAYGLCS